MEDQNESSKKPSTPEQHTRGTVRISTEKLDQLLVELEELISVNTTLEDHLDQIKDIGKIVEKQQHNLIRLRSSINDQINLSTPQATGVAEAMENLRENIFDSHQKLTTLQKQSEADAITLGKLVSVLLESLKETLMQPFSLILQPLHKVVRDLAKSLNKEIDFSVSGELTEVDKRILEELKDPLLHIIRNALDHGIESPKERSEAQKTPQGRFSIDVQPLSDQRIEVKIYDDGRGFDIDKIKKKALEKNLIASDQLEKLTKEEIIQLVFKSDLSTADRVSEISGQGLGLEIVAERVKSLNGTIRVESEVGVGTTMFLLIPSKRSTFRGIHIKADARDFILPTSNVNRLVRIDVDEIKKIENRDAIFIDDAPIPLVNLASLLGIKDRVDRKQKTINVVVASASKQTVAFEIDEVIKERPVLMKKFNRQLEGLKTLSAVTVLEATKIVPILNPVNLIHHTFKGGHVNDNERQIMENEEENKVKRALVVDDSPTSLLLLKNIVSQAGYEVITAKDGEEAYLIMQREEVDILITDINMPKMDGFDLCDKLRKEEKFAKFPIIFVTALNSDEDRQRGVEVGVDAYIAKSDFDTKNFLAKINELT